MFKTCASSSVDRVFHSEWKGQEFDPLLAHQNKNPEVLLLGFFYMVATVGKAGVLNLIEND